MKTIILFFSLFIFAYSYGQNQKIMHLEISTSALFWTPTDNHIKATNSFYSAEVPNSYVNPMANVTGYGATIAPAIRFNYYYKNFLGITLGFNYLHLRNYLELTTPYAPPPGYYVSEFLNEAYIYNLQLGYCGQTIEHNGILFYYGAGLNFVINYDLGLNLKLNFYELGPYHAIGNKIGLYAQSGLKIKLFPYTYFNLGLEYSYIPTSLEYIDMTNNSFNKDSNLGGFAGVIGLSFKFLNY